MYTFNKLTILKKKKLIYIYICVYAVQQQSLDLVQTVDYHKTELFMFLRLA